MQLLMCAQRKCTHKAERAHTEKHTKSEKVPLTQSAISKLNLSC